MGLHNYRQPWYELYQHMGCSGYIYVNDVVVSKHFGINTKSGMLSGQVPINNVLLQSGRYKVRVAMLPRYGQKTLMGTDNAVMIDFNLSDIDRTNLYRWKETQHSFHPALVSPDSQLVPNPDPKAEYANMGVNVIDGLPTYIIETEIDVEVPYVLDGWQNSIDLTKWDKETLKKRVLEYYRQIHAVLKEHNASKFLELSKEKQKLQEQAFYLNKEKKQNLEQDLAALFNENLELEPLIENELKLEFMGYGKLVRLMKIDGSQPLQFKSPNPKEQGNVELDVKLHARSLEKGLSII